MADIFVKSYSSPEVNRREILRYMGCQGDDSEEIAALIDECLAEACPKLSYKVCYGRFAFSALSLPESKNLQANLRGCDQVILFGATIGIEMDRLIAKYSRIAPSKALCLQAVGAERIESLCDVFSKEVAAESKAAQLYTRPRFSPGYGDFPLEAQREIFKLLDCSRKIGLSLNESLLMSPSKSVTAIIGIAGSGCKSSHLGNCHNCSLKNCDFRRK